MMSSKFSIALLLVPPLGTLMHMDLNYVQKLLSSLQIRIENEGVSYPTMVVSHNQIAVE